MENIMIILICLVLMALSIVWVLCDGMEENNETASELHARDRYAVAERIDKEFFRN
ncbi:MAG TPA: hypothetical protein VFG54_18945 [Prolixibacteraceae bacterium]|nr:hypothetical protein [Prolixibacteraceae bacterium]